MENQSKDGPPGAGGNSFSFVDPEKVFGEIRLRQGSTFLDMGCGMGQYAFYASKIIGDKGIVHAVDLWEEGIAVLLEEISTKGIGNIRAIVGDVSKRIPIESKSVDRCFLATTLHDLVRSGSDDGALREASRVLKTDGALAIIEFKKMDGPPGPPVQIRLSAEEVEEIVIPFGFRKEGMTEVGPYHYLMIFHLFGAP